MRKFIGFAPYLLWRALRLLGVPKVRTARLARWLGSLGYETILLSDLVTITVTMSAPPIRQGKFNPDRIIGPKPQNVRGS
jgi:hypothetical protein